MNPDSWKTMVERSNELTLALGNGEKIVEENEKNSYVVQRRGLYYKNDLKSGYILTKEDLIALRPRAYNSLSPWVMPDLIGKRLTRNVNKNEMVKENDIQA